MITKFKGRVLSFILAASIIIGSIVLPVGVFAANVTPAETLLLLNRDFEDNTAVTNGFGATQVAGNTIVLEKEDGNTYMHWVFDSTASTTHGHFNIDISAYLPDEGSVVLRARVRTEDAYSKNRVAILARPYDYHHGAEILKPDGTFYGYNSNASGLLTFSRKASGSSYVPTLGLLDDTNRTLDASEFVEVAYVFSWTDKANVTVNAYYDGSTTPQRTYTMKSYGVDARPCYFRFQVNTGLNTSWDLDDLNIYVAYTNNDAAALAATFGAANRGPLFNANAGAYVDPGVYNGNYYFKVNVDHALGKDGSTVYDLAEKPFSDANGKIWFPVSALETVVGKLDSKSPVKRVNGIECVQMEDIHLALYGYHYSYESSGLVAISEKEEVFVEGAPKNGIISIMQKFIFDHVDSDLKKVEAFSAEDGQYLNHPYIFADQDKFDSLRATYLDVDGTADQTLKSYITTRVNSAENVYKNYAVVKNGAYYALDSSRGLSGGQKNIYEMPYLDAQGYDIGGRHSQATSHAGRIQELAFAWQITRDDKYALLAYDYAVAIGGWEHWGPGHFLNCADAAAPYSTAYDWLYPAWVELGLDVAKIEQIIFTNAVVPGYYSRSANTIPEGWMRYISGVLTKSGWGFNGTNNWNAVCSSGMVIASLAIVGRTTPTENIYIDTNVNGVPFEKTQLVSALGTHTGFSTYRDYAEWLINECMYGMAMNGLMQYIPDGSYIESAGYWSYGTNNFFEMVAALTTATEYNTGVSTDFGMLDAWGIDRTCYYALNTQSGDYKTFNYHDSGSGSVSAQDTSWFAFYGNYTGKTDLAAIRVDALASGKSGSATLADVLFYVKPVGEYTKPALQYWWEGINGYVVRDSWEAGSIYAGIMGDTNNLGHGQIDSGSFVYHNGGTVWFCDIGTEAYNAYGFWGAATRYRYYKMNAEGNNTLFLASRDAVPYGQALNGFGKIIETGDNSYGAYTIIDNTSVYGGYASSAYRGMLLTNDRRTLVIQDEVEFLSNETAYWVGHTEQEVILSVDGTVAYMTDGKTVIRVTIADMNNSGARFVIEDCYTYHLKASDGMDEIAYEHYLAGTHELNYDRSQYKKLTIALDGVKSVKLAIIIEEVAVGEIFEVGYEWQSMADWDENTPTSDGKVSSVQTSLHTGDASLVGNVTVIGARPNLSLTTNTINNSTAYVISSSNGDGATTISFNSKPGLAEFGYLADRTIAAEFDLGTLGSFPTGARISLVGAGVEIIGIDLSDLGTIATSVMQRITLVIDGKEGRYYVFFGETLVVDSAWANASVEDIALTVKAPAGALSGSILLDNVSIRTFGSDYTSLREAIKNSSINEWADRLAVSNSGRTPVARLTVGNVLPGDSPIVDLFGNATVTVNVDNNTVIELYSWEDVEKALKTATYVEVLLPNNHYPIKVDYPVTIDTNGIEFYSYSEGYMAFIDGDTVEYRKGSVTVTFVTENGTFTEVYTASIPASYKGTLDTKVYERAVDGGYEYYVKDGWSGSRNGNTLSENGMIVTNKNCVFYQSDKSVEGAFATVKNGTITIHTDSDLLFTSATKGGYDRISLLSDIVFDSTDLATNWSGTVNLYLNGYTITYRSEKSSDHMHQSSATVNIYGPGKLVSEAASSNLFLVTGGVTTVRDVTIESVRPITDHRGGKISFINCDVTITKSGISAFGVRNRNNAETETGKNGLPTVIIDNCRINMPYLSGNVGVFSVACNAVMSVTNTEIRVASGGVLFALETTTVGTVTGFDFDNSFNKMQVKIGNVLHNCGTFVTTKSNAPSGNSYPEMAQRIGYTEGAFLTWDSVNSTIYDGCVAARQNDAANPYVVAKPEDTVNVTWRVGGSVITERWLKGSLPNAENPTLRALLTDVGNGLKHTFNLHVVNTDSEFVATTVTDFPVSVNLSLHTAFTLNIYIAKTSGVTLRDFEIDGVGFVGVDHRMDDGTECIKLSVDKLNPATAAETISLVVTFDDANTGVNGAKLILNISLVSYIDKVLSGDYSEEAKGLMGNVLKYVKNAYDYEGNELYAEYASIITVMEKHEKYMSASVVKRENTDLSSLTHAVTSAALYLENSPAFRFYVNDGYNGNITLSYESLAGGTISYTYRSVDFVTETVDGVTRRYVDLGMRAFDFASRITITVDGENGSVSDVYSLAMYYHSVATEIGMITEFINSIYAYSESAAIYREYSELNGLN